MLQPVPVLVQARTLPLGQSISIYCVNRFMLLGFVAVMSANLIGALHWKRRDSRARRPWVYLPVVMGLQGMMMGLGIGASSVVARSIGSGEWRRAKALITHSFVLVLAFVALITLFMAFFLEDIFPF